jgi:virulence-associated protein VapD
LKLAKSGNKLIPARLFKNTINYKMKNNETNSDIELLREILKDINDKMESKGFDATQKLRFLNKVGITTMGMVISNVEEKDDVLSASFEEIRRYAASLEEITNQIKDAQKNQ